MTVSSTFAFVDLAGFTALTETHGDDEAVAVVKGFQTRARVALADQGVLVKTIGDAVMLAFEEPHAAVVTLARLFEAEHRAGAPLLPRAGAHHGCALSDGSDFYGHAVNVAARVAACAGAGQLLATREVAVAARDLGHVVTHLGRRPLRNIATPVDVYMVDLGHDRHGLAVDPVCAMQVPTSGPRAISLRWRDEQVWFCGLPCVARFAASDGEPRAVTGPEGTG